MHSIDELKNDFQIIKRAGWIKSHGRGTGAIGITFEALLGNKENSQETPDFGEIEIKTKRSYRHTFVNLFHMAPKGQHLHEIEYLTNQYGYPDNKAKEYKVLNCPVFATKKTYIINSDYSFKLKVDRNDQKIYLCVFNKDGVLIEKTTYWDFDTLKEKVYRKLKTLAFIKGDRSFIEGKEYFKYESMEIYTLKDFPTFISLIEKGIIRISFSVGVYKIGRRKGQTRDHGTSFGIQEQDFLKLYNLYQKTN